MSNIGTHGLGNRDGFPEQAADGEWYLTTHHGGWKTHISAEDARHFHHAEKFVELYGDPWCGRHRATFDRGDGWVIKVALNSDGEYANLLEAMEFERGVIPIATCSLEHSEVDPSITVLIMEKVDVDYHISCPDIPEWVGSYRVVEISSGKGEPMERHSDGYQIGLTADGRIVAYDL